MSSIPGQIAWLSKNPEGTKILHLKLPGSQKWIPYTESSVKSLMVPDYLIPRGSKGYATMQVLFKRGWKLVSSDSVQAEEIAEREMVH